MEIKNAVVAGALALVLGNAQAGQTFDYSYKLYDGPTVSGSFSGDANGNLITNLSNITASLDGIAFTGSGSLSSFAWRGSALVGGAVASFDGLRSNFFFTDAGRSNYFYAIPWTSSFVTDAAQARTPKGYVDFYNGNYSASSWHVVAAPIPEPETYAMMLAGLGLLGLTARRRKWSAVARFATPCCDNSTRYTS